MYSNKVHFLALFLCHCAFAEEFPYSIGDLRTFCPNPQDVWHSIGTNCFKKDPIGLRMNWTEANNFCGLEMNNHSDALHLENWLLHRDLSRKFLLQRAPNGQNEFWTAWYIDVRWKGLPELVHRFGSAQNTSIYNPTWASLEPHLANSEPGRWCISWGAALLDEINFGWHLRNCSDSLPVICQTFACYLDGTGLPQHRCADNSACISHRALCDGVSDCESGDDELAQNCDGFAAHECENNEEKITEISDLSGDIWPIEWQIVSTKFRDKNCLPRREKWIIEQKAGARIKLDFLALQLDPNDSLSVVDLERGDHFQISQNEKEQIPSILAANRLLILYERFEPQNEGEGTVERRGFHLHYAVDDANVCIRTFESWNGSFAVPMDVPDTGHYRTPMQCQWTIENRSRGIVLVKFPPFFRLSPGDVFGLSLRDTHSAVIQFGQNFSSVRPVPSLLVTNAARIHFFFHAKNGSSGDGAVRAVFQRTCDNGPQQFVDSAASGNVLIVLKNAEKDPINCSIQIKVAKKGPFSFFVDELKTTGKDQLNFINADAQGLSDGGASIDGVKQFRSLTSNILLNILLNFSSLEAKIAYSIDCQHPIHWHSASETPKNFPFRYRFPSVPCPIGNASAEMICADGGTWQMFGCQEKENYEFFVKILARQCVVPRIWNGLVTQLNRQNGTLHFRCNFGFSPSGKQKSVCTPAGQWSPAPKCSAIHCADHEPRAVLPKLAIYLSPERYLSATSSTARPNSDNRFGSLVAFECANGTVPRGLKSVAQCTTNGQWTSVEMACERIGCYATNVALGNFSSFWTPPGDVAQINCVQGAQLAIKELPKCILEGFEAAKWEGVPTQGIKCQFENLCEKFDQNPCGSNGICVGLNGGYTCNCTSPTHRFNRNATFGAQCEEMDRCSAGLWPCSGGTCKSAAASTHPLHSTRSPAHFSPPFECICPENTHILYDDEKAAQNRIVFPSHRWLIPGHSCIINRCQPPAQMPQEQFVVHPLQSLHFINSTVSIYCRHNAHSAPIGPVAELRCLPNGQWNGTMMPNQCQKAFAMCEAPVLPNKGTQIRGQKLAEYSVNSVVEFECVQWTFNGKMGTDYLMIGHSQSVCLPSGKWTNEPPACILPQCSEISIGIRNNGLHISLENGPNWPTDEKFGPGATVKMICEKSGEQWTMTCKRLGSSHFEMAWSMDKLPKCGAEEPVDGTCDMSKLAHSLHGLPTPSREKVPLGQEVSFTCAQPNYALSDRKTWKCVKNTAPRRRKEVTDEGQSRRSIVVGDQQPDNAQLDALINAAKPEKEVIFDNARRVFGWHSSIHWTQNAANGTWMYRPVAQMKNFLITPPMEVSAGDWLSLSVEIEPRPCADCTVWVGYFAGESSFSDPPPAEHFNSLGRIAADPLVHSIQFFPPDSKLRIHLIADDKSPNFVVQHVRVIGTACPALHFNDFTNFPRTLARFENQTISAQCQSGKSLHLICSPRGNWLLPENENGCACPNGYSLNSQGKCDRKEALLCHRCSSDSDSHCISLTSADNVVGTNAVRCASSTALCMVRSHTRSGASHGDHQPMGGEGWTTAEPLKMIRGCAERAECGIFRSNVSARESCLTDPDGIETCTICCSDDLCNGVSPRQLLSGGGVFTIRRPAEMSPTYASSTTTTTQTIPTTTITTMPATTAKKWATTSFVTTAPAVTPAASTVISSRTTPMWAMTRTAVSEDQATRPNSSAFELDSPAPFCIDQQPLELRCISQLQIPRQIDGGQSEPIIIPWPTVVDNDPHIRVQPVNVNISNKAHQFRGDETEIIWRAVDLHGETKHCVTKLLFFDTDASIVDDKLTLPSSVTEKEADIQCPEWHIRTVNVSAEFSGDPLTDKPPLIRAEYPPMSKTLQNSLSFDPPRGTFLALGVPKLVSVSVSGIQKCQFWYQTLSIDCPLWALGPGNWHNFKCVNELNGMMRCKRKEPCGAGGREYPQGLRELRCWRNRPGEGLTYTTEKSDENGEELPLIGEPQCLEEQSPSAITVSIIVASDVPECAIAMTRQINAFFAPKCPNIRWSLSALSDFVHPNLTVQNLTAETTNGGNGQLLLNCIQQLKTNFGTAFANNFGMLISEHCPEGSVQARHFAYHLQCPLGWAPNELFKCEKCPKGHFSFNGTCSKCPIGTFAAHAAQTKCTACPEETNTVGAGSVAEWQCLARCPSNTFSAVGLAPCRACQSGKCQAKAAQEITSRPSKDEEEAHFDCTSDGCSDHGKCQNGICSCDLGFVGTDCSVPLDLCSAQFCLNSAQCLFDVHSGSLCICPRGFYGRRCELSFAPQGPFLEITQQKVVGLCNNESFAADNANACSNGACRSGICQCNAGFVKGSLNGNGHICVPINACLASEPCQNGAKNCTDEANGRAICECANGWSGEFCEQHSNSCFLPQNHCLNGGTCVWEVQNCIVFPLFRSIFSTRCLCPSAFNGVRCEQNGQNERLELCHLERRCGLNGKCQLNISVGALFCQCDRGYFGEFCESQLNPCSPFAVPIAPICHNGGICQAIDEEKAVCQCPPGWMGAHCETMVSACAKMKCQNGGHCIDGIHDDSAYCICPDGYGGEHCQLKLGPCNNWQIEGSVAICGNGQCRAKGKGHNAKYECLCDDGWTGSNCNVPRDECQTSNKCGNNGKCVPLIDGDPRKWACICQDGFWGEHCENVVNYCDLDGICLNNGSCESIGPNYRCHCDHKKGRFFGRNCEQIITPCDPNPCANGGKCSLNYDTPTSFSCECGPNYVPGTNCTRKMNHCEQWPNYCNGGQCQLLPANIDDDGPPHCLCPADSMGIRCETRKASHYDLHFHPPSTLSSPILQTIRSPTFPCLSLLKSAFSLCFWLRVGPTDGQMNKAFLLGSSRTVYISINASPQSKNSETSVPLVQFDQFGVQLFDKRLLLQFDRPLVAQLWHHVCLTFDTKVFRLFLNGHFVEASPSANFVANSANDSCEILLGENGGERNFVGQLSQVELYSKQFEHSEIVRMAWRCREWTHHREKKYSLIEWAQFTTVDVFNKAIIALIPGICSESDCQPGRAANCGPGKKTKTPPEVLSCPHSQFITVPMPHQRLTQIHWEGSLEKMFRPSGTSPIVRFESNFRPGQSFGWGQFHVVYLAEDALGNWATCEFDVVVSPTKCSDLFVPGSFNKLTVHKFRVEEAKQTEKSINLKCLNTQLVSNVVAKPPFYTCDRLGQWDRWASLGRPFALPSCTPTENAMQEVVGDLHFDATCADAADYALQVVETIGNVSQKFGSFCVRPLCEGQLGIKTECLGEENAAGEGGDDHLLSTAAPHSQTTELTPLDEAEERKQRRQSLGDVQQQQQTVRVLFDLSVNNSQRAVAPIIRDIMESKFGANFVGESTRLQCSNAFPQLHINGDAKIAASASVAMASEPPLVQCATCAPGETWQQIVRKIATTTKDESVLNSDMSGSCVKCPANSFKPSPGVHPCTPCKEDRITGGMVGCMREIDCYCPFVWAFLNCPPGSVYCSMTDSCIKCAYGQYMPYSGRLQCIGCPPGTTTEEEGSISADQCSVRCSVGEELGAEEQCEMCTRGTYRAEGMNACRRCNLGFTTPTNGAKSALDCSVVFCPRGYFRNTSIGPDDQSFNQLNFAFETVCVPCPIAHYQDDYGADRCVRCPIGWQTVGIGAKSVQECDQATDSTCKPDEPEPCPEGMECVQTRGQTYECHNLPNMDRTDRGDAWRRLWIPLVILALFAVFVLTILCVIFIKNRQKWLLMLSRNCPSRLLLCCKKMTVDDLASDAYIRRSPAASIGRVRPVADTRQQTAEVEAAAVAHAAQQSGRGTLAGQGKVTENGGTVEEGRHKPKGNAGKIKKMCDGIRNFNNINANGAHNNFAARPCPAESPSSPSLKSNEKVEDPLGEIRTGLMEMNANDGEGSEGSRRISAPDNGHQKFASPTGNRRPHLTVQTKFPITSDLNEKEGPFVRAVRLLNRDGHAAAHSGPARATAEAIGMRVLGMDRREGQQRHDEDGEATHALRRPHRAAADGLVGLRCKQFDQGFVPGNVPLRSSLTGRSPLVANSLFKPSPFVPAEQSATVVPSYDDDDDAFFS